MFKTLFQVVGADYQQWMALTRAALKRDFRQSTLSTTLRHGRSGGRIFLTLIYFYLLTGLIFVPLVLSNPNVILSVNFLILYTMFMVGGLILVEFHTVVISPEDYFAFGFLPISTKTFFLAKLTNILFYVLTFTLVLALPAMVALFITSGFQFIFGLSLFISVLLANFVAAMAIILFYAYIIKKVSVRRLQNWLALFQIGLSLIIYSGFFIIQRVVSNPTIAFGDWSRSPWLLWLPSTWFTSLVNIALGQVSFLNWSLSGFALLVAVLLGYLAVSKLSLGYSEKMYALTTRPDTRKISSEWALKPFLLFAKAHEERVVSKLIRNQFVYDNKFKMAVLGILPLTVFYLFLGMEQGPLPDPFVTSDLQMSRSGLLYLLIFLFPMMLRTFVTQSDAYQASWIFYATPTDVRRLILSEKNFLMIYFVLPFLGILGWAFYYFFANVLHVLLHILVLGLLAHLFLQFAFLYSPDLPFSRPNVKGSRTRNLTLFLIVIPFVIYFLLPLIFKYVYTSSFSFLTFVITIFMVSVLLESLIQVRVSLYLKKSEFTG